MQGDIPVSVLVCVSMLAGIVVGLRFNVKLLLLLCLATIVAGVGAGVTGLLGPGHASLTTAVTVVALQVGYFVSVVITAMRLTEEPVTVTSSRKSAEATREALSPRRS